MLPGHEYLLQRGHVAPCDVVNPCAERLRELVDEAPDEEWNVFGASPQRRHFDREDVETIVEVFAERPLMNPLLEIPVRGRYDAHVDTDRLRTAEPLDVPILQDAEQLHLHVRGQVADLVEKNRRVVGQFEAPDLSRRRAGEGAFLPAEQLAFHQGPGNGGAVHPDHRVLAPCAQVVKMAGDQLLAGSGLPQQQHGRIRGGHPSNLLENVTNGWTLTDGDPGPGAQTSAVAQVRVGNLRLIATTRRSQPAGVGRRGLFIVGGYIKRCCGHFHSFRTPRLWGTRSVRALRRVSDGASPKAFL